MNIDEALIERIIREVVSQVVAEKAAGSGQNRSASGNNQNSMQSVNLGQIEQLVKNVASGDGQTSFGGQTSNAPNLLKHDKHSLSTIKPQRYKL